MEEARMIELLVALHEGLDRLGPGDSRSTLRALHLCTELAPKPNILDIGCGTGAQTLTLAKNTDGMITATGLVSSVLSTATDRVAVSGFQSHASPAGSVFSQWNRSTSSPRRQATSIDPSLL